VPDAPSGETAPASPGQVGPGQVSPGQVSPTAVSLATEGEDGGRPLRADARRNRDRLLEVAVRAFSQNGPDVTLDAIAKEAGVGIGTLYRHFPTREALIEAAYRNELARLCDSVPELLEGMPPDQAARTWMDRYIDYMATKRGMADALRVVIASGGTPYAQSRDRLLTAIATLLKAGNEAGTLRADVPPGDALTSLSGVALAAGAPDQRDQAGRLLDLLMDALRYRPSPAGTP
jgi:AcrR family transcriptional regulator